MRDDVEDLYDYDALRRVSEATMFVVHVTRPTLVLGSSQSHNVINFDALGDTPLRRRRGGGGLVLLRPDDIWVDWWLPHDDPRWSNDVHVSSMLAGHWWAEALGEHTSGLVSVHAGALEGNPDFRVVCFAGRGPGEVFINERKTVGLTQWRVREGVFLSTVLHAQATSDVLAYLSDVPEGLSAALDHQILSSLRLRDPDDFIDELALSSGPWRRRPLLLTP